MSPPPENAGQEPTKATRVQNFARFFKNYMSVSAIVAAALPIPVTAFKLIPTYKAHTSLLSTYTSLFCFLILGFIFYSRHQLARLMFPRFAYAGLSGSGRNLRLEAARFFVAVLPGVLILLSLFCVYGYHLELDRSVAFRLGESPPRGWPLQFQPALSVALPTEASPSPSPGQKSSSPKKAADVLNTVESWQLPESGALVILYLGIFLFAESAFIVMAIKEYLQDLIKVSEVQLIQVGGPLGEWELERVAASRRPAR